MKIHSNQYWKGLNMTFMSWRFLLKWKWNWDIICARMFDPIWFQVSVQFHLDTSDSIHLQYDNFNWRTSTYQNLLTSICISDCLYQFMIYFCYIIILNGIMTMTALLKMSPKSAKYLALWAWVMHLWSLEQKIGYLFQFAYDLRQWRMTQWLQHNQC